MSEKQKPNHILNPNDQMVCPNCGDNTEGKARDFLIPGKEHIHCVSECYACNLERVAWMEGGKVHVKSK